MERTVDAADSAVGLRKSLRTSLNGDTLTVYAEITLNDFPLFMDLMAEFEQILLLTTPAPSGLAAPSSASETGGPQDSTNLETSPVVKDQSRMGGDT